MGLSAGTGTHILPTPYPNMYRWVLDTPLMHVSTNSSVSSMPPVDLMVTLLESPNMPQSPLSQLLLYGVYLLPRTFSLPLSGSIPHYGCGMVGGGGGPIFCQSA